MKPHTSQQRADEMADALLNVAAIGAAVAFVWALFFAGRR